MCKLFFRFILVLLFFLSGCSDVSSSIRTEEGNTLTPINNPTQTNFNLSPVPAITQSTITPSSSPESTKTPTPSHTVGTQQAVSIDANPSVQCITIKPIIPLDFETSGRIILEEFQSFSSQGYLYQMDPKTGLMDRLTEEKSEFHSDVSPNRKWLAYKAVDESAPQNAKLIIMTSEGKVAKEIPWLPNWRSIAGWLDNEQLWIDAKGGFPEPLVLLNPFTGENKPFLPAFPDILTAHPPYIQWDGFSLNEMVYDPTLTRVVYPDVREGTSSLVLWDVLKGDLIARLNPGFNYGSKPIWSEDGQQFVKNMEIAPKNSTGNETHEELFRISRDGKIQRLTYLLSSFKQVGITEYSWSPDKRYIAFLVFAEPFEYPDIFPDTNGWHYPRLAVYDMKTGEVINYCIPTDSVLSPVWSPDSRQLVIRYSYGDQPLNKSHVYLIDLSESYAIKIAEDITPVGWMKSP